MAGRLLDVLNDEEKDLTARIAVAKSELEVVGEQLAADARRLAKIKRDQTAEKAGIEDLQKQAHELGIKIEAAGVRHDHEKATEAYQVQKPDRYDVEVYQVANGKRNGAVRYYVKMWWGNRTKIIYEGVDDMAHTIARNVADLTGQKQLNTHAVESKKDIW